MQHYVIKFVGDLRQVWFSPGTTVSSTNKSYRHDITEILLKVTLNTTTLTLQAVNLTYFYNQIVIVSYSNQ
jgi:hypothetical protein